jgi:polysaccharide deacetylase family protein (PEP-CTERM system associated)
VRVLTFDIEDWFHILDNPSTHDEAAWDGFEPRVEQSTARILEELAARGARATFFCLGWIAERYPQLIRRIDAAGHEIGTHSHAHQLAFDQSVAEFDADLGRSIRRLEDLTGKPIRAYRAPGFSVTRSNPWVFERLIEHGIEVDSSVFPARRAHGGFQGGYGVPSWIECGAGRLRELPMNIGRILGRDIPYSGGGYFRLLPYRVIRGQLARDPYVMTYFHPRDFDPGQPMIPGLSRGRRFKCYVGLASAFAKLRRMLDEFEFVDLRTAVERIDWAAAPVLRVDEDAASPLAVGAGRR